MSNALDFEELYAEIHSCRKCPNVISSLVPRCLNEVYCQSSIVLMAQAPSEKGVRQSGVHWIGPDGHIRKPGGVFLEKYLNQIGYSIDPHSTGYARPYTTNVLHCWTGRYGKRDRKPSSTELQNCKQWWQKELFFVKAEIVILLGKPAAESFSVLCGDNRSFKDTLISQGQVITFGHHCVRRYVIPHPTAPYVGKSRIYQKVFNSIKGLLCRS